MYDFAEMRIDMLIVLAVIFVIGRRYKKRIAVYGIDAEILQIVQSADNALQIAPVEFTDVIRRGILVPGINMNKNSMIRPAQK